ncbi:flagellar motor protein MotB [Thalassobaculum sp.]|uniref:OmpA/MotB family protein n=1 Tax=Thalassobaculum sp. TaxID=2022740 RepID=UPI0032ED4EA9
MARRPTAEPPEPDIEDESAPAAGLGGRADSFERIRSGASATQGSSDAEAEDEHAWLTTYTDMVTLLLTCFIMLISVATFTGGKSAPSVVPPDPVRGEAGAPPSTLPDRPAPAAGPPAPHLPDALFLRQPPQSWSARMSRDLQRFVGMATVPGGLTVETAETVVTVRLTDSLMFPSGRVEIAPEGLDLLRELAPLLEASPARIEVQGHTDSVPIGSWLFPSNWELSAARAAAVVRALVGAGMPPDRLFVAGFADTRPLAGNDDEAGRRANRRVELVLRAPFDPPGASGIPGPEANR